MIYFSLSVTSNGDVLLLSSTKIDLYYRGKEDHLQTITLPTDVIDPKHAVQTSRGTFIMSHGADSGSLHRICEVKVNGQLVQSFGGQNNSKQQLGGTGGLSNPRHLALDGEGRVYIVDNGNKRVIVLDSTLRRCNLMTDLGTPSRLHCSIEGGGQLLAGYDEGYVDVYNVHISE